MNTSDIDNVEEDKDRGIGSVRINKRSKKNKLGPKINCK